MKVQIVYCFFLSLLLVFFVCILGFLCLNTWYTKNDVFSGALMHAVEHDE